MFFKRKNHGEFKSLLYSKMGTNRWPSISAILAKIHSGLPMIDCLQVKVFEDSDAEQGLNLRNTKVKLVSTYSTQAQEQLNKYLS